MCNCGQKRNDYTPERSAKISESKQVAQPQNKMVTDVYFEYTGKTALSVKGGISGKNYRFIFPGDVQPVDYRDASGMSGISILRKMIKEKS